MVDLKYDIQNIIYKTNLAWLGHVCKLPDDSLVKRSVKEEFKKKRGRGRPPKKWTDIFISDRYYIVPTHFHCPKIYKRLLQREKTCEYKVGETSTGVCSKVK